MVEALSEIARGTNSMTKVARPVLWRKIPDGERQVVGFEGTRYVMVYQDGSDWIGIVLGAGEVGVEWEVVDRTDSWKVTA